MTRLERIRNMELGEMADFLMSLNDGGPRLGFCQNSANCFELLEKSEIAEGMCHNCMVGYLLSEGDIP